MKRLRWWWIIMSWIIILVDVAVAIWNAWSGKLWPAVGVLASAMFVLWSYNYCFETIGYRR